MIGWWVVKRGDEYFAGVVQDDMAVWVTVQNQAWQFPSRSDAHARASETVGRVVRVRARVPARGPAAAVKAGKA